MAAIADGSYPVIAISEHLDGVDHAIAEALFDEAARGIIHQMRLIRRTLNVRRDRHFTTS